MGRAADVAFLTGNKRLPVIVLCVGEGFAAGEAEHAWRLKREEAGALRKGGGAGGLRSMEDICVNASALTWRQDRRT